MGDRLTALLAGRSRTLVGRWNLKCEGLAPDTPVEEEVGGDPMSLTLADVRNVAFGKAPIGKPGYHRDEVNDLLGL